jgi:hypothetical protein
MGKRRNGDVLIVIHVSMTTRSHARRQTDDTSVSLASAVASLGLAQISLVRERGAAAFRIQGSCLLNFTSSQQPTTFD